jgi:glycosyltransferase involved in cell wall biosynthesis
LQRAAHVTCDSHATRQDLLRFDVLPPERMSVVPLGVHPTCSPLPDEAADAHAAELLGNCGETVDLLHVGSTIARKGIDTLLRVFAEARAQIPQLVLPFLDRETLAAVYRRAALVLLPSGAEGFGLPVAEAMACGTPVLASDLAVLREVGGAAASYAAPGDEALWTTELLQLLAERREQPQLWRVRREKGLQQAAGFSWTNYSNRMAYVYNGLLYT